MVPHYNYYPPAGSVVDATDSSITWNGQAWLKNGRAVGVPSTHTLIGKPGGPLSGWHYDWNMRAWLDPSNPPPNGGPVTHGLTLNRSFGPHPMIAARPFRFNPSMFPHPAAPVHPAPQPTPTPAAQPEKKETTVEKKPENPLEALIKHPVTPLAGALLLLAAQFTDEPQPPQIPDDLPEMVAKQWQMIFNQNQQRFARRMAAYENLGMVLLGYASTKTVLDALPPKHA